MATKKDNSTEDKENEKLGTERTERGFKLEEPQAGKSFSITPDEKIEKLDQEIQKRLEVIS